MRAFDSVGRQLWSFTTGGAVLGSPLAVIQKDLAQPGPVQDCAIVAGSEDGNVYGLNPSTGVIEWTYDAGSPIFTSPVLSNPGPISGPNTPGGSPGPGQDVVIAADNGSVYALNGCTGAPVWSDVGGSPGPIQTPAVLSGVKLSDGTTHTIVFVTLNGNLVEALDAGTGDSLWTFSEASPGPMSAPSAYGSGQGARIVFGFGDSVVELNASTGKQVWSFATGGTVTGGVALDNIVTAAGPTAGPDLKLSLHAIIGGDSDGDLYAINPKNGKQLCSESQPGPIQTPSVANGVIYVENSPGPISDGSLEALDASDGSLLFSADLGSTSPGPIQSPAVADGDVFTEDNSGDLLILGLVGTT